MKSSSGNSFLATILGVSYCSMPPPLPAGPLNYLKQKIKKETYLKLETNCPGTFEWIN